MDATLPNWAFAPLLLSGLGLGWAYIKAITPKPDQPTGRKW